MASRSIDNHLVNPADGTVWRHVLAPLSPEMAEHLRDVIAANGDATALVEVCQCRYNGKHVWRFDRVLERDVLLPLTWRVAAVNLEAGTLVIAVDVRSLHPSYRCGKSPMRLAVKLMPTDEVVFTPAFLVMVTDLDDEDEPEDVNEVRRWAELLLARSVGTATATLLAADAAEAVTASAAAPVSAAVSLVPSAALLAKLRALLRRD